MDRAKARDAILRIMDEHPNLTGDGLTRKPLDHPRTTQERAYLCSDQDGVGEFIRALDYLLECRITKTLGMWCSSYTMKHEAELWARSQGHEYWYVCNGALICAAYYRGALVYPSRMAPNADITVGLKSRRMAMKKAKANVLVHRARGLAV